MSSKRAHERKEAFVPGRILLNIPGFSGYCTIRDLSQGGAKLAFGSVPHLPETFELHIPSHGKVHLVEVRWQRGLQIGVQFQSSRSVSITENAAPLPATARPRAPSR
ncbi:MAG TPA: PilZ domain-containing protein [Beijerinckiaceae bacterium]